MRVMSRCRFRDQIVVVTGAASGIGRATALAFVREGARVHLVDLCAEPLQQVSEDFDFRLLKEDRFDEPRDESAWRQKIIFERRPMQDDDWQKLAAVAHEVGVLQHQTRPALRSGTLDSDHDYDYDPLQYVRDWCRFVGAVQTPQRQVWDVEESLEWLATLCNDDSEYCMVLVVLEALGP